MHITCQISTAGHTNLQMLPYPNPSSNFLFDPPSSCFDNDLELGNTTFVDSYINLPFFSFETPPPPPDPAPAPKDRSDGAGGKTTRCGRQRNDRHSKIRTAQGLRDRRMRLSVDVAGRFFALQDMLGFEKASATVDWLLEQSKPAIEQAALRATDVGVPSAVLIDIPGCGSPKSADSSNSLQTTSDHHVLYEKAKGLPTTPSSTSGLAAFKTVSRRRESRAEARARARCRTMEKKKMMLLEAEDGGVGRFDSTEKAPSLVSSNLEHSSCSSLSQGGRRLVDDINMREYCNFECLPIAADGESSPLGMLGSRRSKDYSLFWDDADIDASYELLPRSGIDGSVLETFQLT